MDDQEIMEASASNTIPKLGSGKSLRYEVDDFIVSPPSNEAGGFFHLRYGQRQKPRASTYDRINQELSMKVEIKDGDPMISDINLFGLDNIETPTIDITPTGLSPTKKVGTTTPGTSSHSTKPLFVFHLKNSKVKEEPEDPQSLSTDSTTSTPTSEFTDTLSPTSIELSPVSDSETRIEKSDFLGEEYPKKKEVYRKTSMSMLGINLEKIQALQIAPPVDVSPRTTPRTTPVTSPIPKRKISGVVMDQSATHSYFCTRPFQNNQQLVDASTSVSTVGGSTAMLSTTTAQMTEQMESNAKALLSLDVNQKMGRKRRPKPSTLREMNFWAPTSM